MQDNGGLDPAGSSTEDRAPGGGSGVRLGKAPLKLKAFCALLYKKGQKVKDLNICRVSVVHVCICVFCDCYA